MKLSALLQSQASVSGVVMIGSGFAGVRLVPVKNLTPGQLAFEMTQTPPDPEAIRVFEALGVSIRSGGVWRSPICLTFGFESGSGNDFWEQILF